MEKPEKHYYNYSQALNFIRNLANACKDGWMNIPCVLLCTVMISGLCMNSLLQFQCTACCHVGIGFSCFSYQSGNPVILSNECWKYMLYMYTAGSWDYVSIEPDSGCDNLLRKVFFLKEFLETPCKEPCNCMNRNDRNVHSVYDCKSSKHLWRQIKRMREQYATF